VKIRTAEQLFDFTSGELAWRKKELQALRVLVKDKPNLSANNRNALLRSIITLTYAHWEGFIKSSAAAYLEYVAMQRLRHVELSPSLLALAIRPMLNAASQSRQSEEHIKLVTFFREEMGNRSTVPYKDVVDTESNLSSSVLRNIIMMLGLDYSPYTTKEKMIDEKLLKSRNHIAHGEYVLVDEQEALEIQEQCIKLMELFQAQIDNATALQQFRTTST
jgi:hypothetical protein